MTYHVLARKWRPQTFSDLVGQTHVVKALTFALSQNQVHHAYLLTGTRGVGKTSLARIFAKSLNCERNGVSPEPCGECESCREIKAGKFVDLIEVDAASRTGVDETRELIESVAYLPTKGRYKVYLIDEVHMFSKSSFNALLKTLEEPPEHVKFILATTDPEKLPITILSRCLQFNLKSLTQQQIRQHLVNICQSESIEYEEDALALLASAGDGSMRDTLSMTDQAIAYGRGKLKMAEVSEILGTIHPADIEAILFAIATNNPTQLSEALQRLDNYEIDARAFLIEIMRRLQRMAWAKEGIVASLSPLLQSTVGDIPKALLHLWYDIAAKALPNLSFSGDPRDAVEMTLLRMLAFIPNDWITRHRTPLETTVQAAQVTSEIVVPEVVISAPEPLIDVANGNVAVKIALDDIQQFASQLHAEPIVASNSLDEAEAAFSGLSEVANKGILNSSEELVLDIHAQYRDSESLVDEAAENSWHLSSEAPAEPAPSMDDVRAMMQKASDISVPVALAVSSDTKFNDDKTTVAAPLSEIIDNNFASTPPWEEQPVSEPLMAEQLLAASQPILEEVQAFEIEPAEAKITAKASDSAMQTFTEMSHACAETLAAFDWFAVINKLSLSDFTYHCVSLGLLRLETQHGVTVAVLDMPQKHEVLVTDNVITELATALQGYLSTPIKVIINLTEIYQQTPADIAKLKAKQTQDSLVNNFYQNPVTQQLVNALGAQVIDKTIKEIDA